jgi:S-adenosylmethionine/arginine decarboxylase-like enzyme
MLDAFGKQLLIDAKKCKDDTIDNEVCIRMFINDIVKTLKMTKYGDTVIKRFGSDPTQQGISFFQLILESNISGIGQIYSHCCEYDYEMERDGIKFSNKNAIYLDIFSCCEYNIDDAIECVKKHFGPESLDYKIIDRI